AGPGGDLLQAKSNRRGSRVRERWVIGVEGHPGPGMAPDRASRDGSSVPGIPITHRSRHRNPHVPITNQLAYNPPSTTNSAPVQYELSSLARNNATDATSLAAAVRPIGTLRVMRSRSVGSWPSMSVSMRPGWIELTRTPRRASSMAALFVMPRTAHFDVP